MTPSKIVPNSLIRYKVAATVLVVWTMHGTASLRDNVCKLGPAKMFTMLTIDPSEGAAGPVVLLLATTLQAVRKPSAVSPPFVLGAFNAAIAIPRPLAARLFSQTYAR